MYKAANSVILAVLLSLIACVTIAKSLEAEGELPDNDDYRLVFKDIQMLHPMLNLAPPYGPNPIEVELALTPQNFINFDLRKQQLQILLWHHLHWIDPRLSWAPLQYNNVKNIRLAISKHIWTPDIYLFNMVDGINGGEIWDAHRQAVVSSDGGVSWVLPELMTASCPITIDHATKYPAINQTCSLKYGSWSHSNNMIAMRMGEVSMDFYTQDLCWKVLEQPKMEKHSVKYPCCPEEYDDVTLTLKFTFEDSEICRIDNQIY